MAAIGCAKSLMLRSSHINIERIGIRLPNVSAGIRQIVKMLIIAWSGQVRRHQIDKVGAGDKDRFSFSSNVIPAAGGFALGAC